MKIRQTINNNAKRYVGVVYEHARKIVVTKIDTFNYYDDSTTEKFEFNTIQEFTDWKRNQDWIFKTTKLNKFMKVKEK